VKGEDVHALIRDCGLSAREKAELRGKLGLT
jgi:hypothetical protein